jgi:hypothetical protein
MLTCSGWCQASGAARASASLASCPGQAHLMWGCGQVILQISRGRVNAGPRRSLVRDEEAQVRGPDVDQGLDRFVTLAGRCAGDQPPPEP